MILNCTVYSFPSPVRLTVYTLFTIIHQILGRQVVEEHLSAVGSNLAPVAATAPATSTDVLLLSVSVAITAAESDVTRC